MGPKSSSSLATVTLPEGARGDSAGNHSTCSEFRCQGKRALAFQALPPQGQGDITWASKYLNNQHSGFHLLVQDLGS